MESLRADRNALAEQKSTQDAQSRLAGGGVQSWNATANSSLPTQIQSKSGRFCHLAPFEIGRHFKLRLADRGGAVTSVWVPRRKWGEHPPSALWQSRQNKQRNTPSRSFLNFAGLPRRVPHLEQQRIKQARWCAAAGSSTCLRRSRCR